MLAKHTSKGATLHSKDTMMPSTKVEELNRIDTDVTQCWEVMKAQQANKQEDANKQLQQLTTHNTVLAELIQPQQKKIDELLETSNKIMAAL